jgi:hypothetical protein
MRDPLAERLLATVMEWSEEDVARERPILQAMAAYKYDEYQKFSPGMRFVESLALWLSQFKTVRERKIAYDFVKKKLIFCSTAELSHLVGMAYPDHVRPLLLRRAAVAAGLNAWQVAKVAGSQEFLTLQRSCLFLGLSDGARIDVFRRYNTHDLSHEQVYPIYEIAAGRSEVLISKLRASLASFSVPDAGTAKFTTVILMDDFSASGMSYLRKEPEGYDGKIAKFFNNDVNNLIDLNETEFYVLLYRATEQAQTYLKNELAELSHAKELNCSLVVVDELSSAIKLVAGDGEPIEELIEEYYDSEIQDEHSDKGGSGLKYGFADCGLPVILSHNTPNNSLALLWAETDQVRALFPRISRHNKKP